MRPAPSSYKEGEELTEYVCRNYRRLLREADAAAVRVGAAAAVGMAPGETAIDFLTRTTGYEEGGEVAAARAALEALDAARERFMRDLLLARHATAIRINRCPACGRIVATPKARQCLWCGHDWHDEATGASAGGADVTPSPD